MKILWIMIAGATLIWTTPPAVGGYRDLKQELNAYAPPALLRQPVRSAPGAKSQPTAFAAETATIQKMRNRWEKALDATTTMVENVKIQPAIIAAAGDDARTLGLLRPRFSLPTLQALVLLRNPAVKAAADRFKASLEGFDQVTQLDEILRQYAAFTQGVQPGVGPMINTDNIRMKFPFPGVLALKGEVAEKNVEAEKQSLDLVRRDILTQARKGYWSLLYTHRALRITRDLLVRLNQLESVATTRYGAGKTSYQDVVKIRINREKLAEQLTTLTAQRRNQEIELLALMDLGPGSSIGAPERLTPDTALPRLETLYPLAQQKRQELNRLRAMKGKTERMVAMAETMIQPAFTQDYSLYANEAILQVGSAAVKPTFATTISPVQGKGLPKNAWFGTRDTYLRETRRKLEALRADLQDAEARTGLMVRTGWYDLDRAQRELALYKNRLLALSQTSLEVSTRGYASGNVSFADVINAYTDWLEINLGSQRRDSDVGIARAELERRVGAPLP